MSGLNPQGKALGNQVSVEMLLVLQSPPASLAGSEQEGIRGFWFIFPVALPSLREVLAEEAVWGCRVALGTIDFTFWWELQ